MLSLSTSGLGAIEHPSDLKIFKPHQRKIDISANLQIVDMISQIWIGASCNFLEARAHIRELLIQYGYDLDRIEIKQSNLPIRI